MSEPEPYGFERAAAGKSLLFDASEVVDSGADGAVSFADGVASSSASTGCVGAGAGRGMARTVRGTARLRSTERLSTSTTCGALLGADCASSTAGFTADMCTTGAVAETAAAACALGRCFKLRTREAPAADAVTHTTSAIQAETQRGRSLSVSAI